jgi:hypothetical protein
MGDAMRAVGLQHQVNYRRFALHAALLLPASPYRPINPNHCDLSKVTYIFVRKLPAPDYLPAYLSLHLLFPLRGSLSLSVAAEKASGPDIGTVVKGVARREDAYARGS